VAAITTPLTFSADRNDKTDDLIVSDRHDNMVTVVFCLIDDGCDNDGMADCSVVWLRGLPQ